MPTNANHNDLVLIDEVLKGNINAYNTLVERYQNFVFTIAYKLINKREEAEEAAQDCFVKCYHSLKNFKRESKFSTWLYTIAHNTTLTFLRKKKLDIVSIQQGDNEGWISNMADEQGENQFDIKSKQILLKKATEKLPDTDAMVLTLFYQGEQTLDEIASIMKMESNAVKVKLFRARNKLKTILENDFKEELAEIAI